MTKFDKNFPLTSGLNPWIAIPVIVLFSIGSMIIFSQVSLVFIRMLFGFTQSEFYFLIYQQTINEDIVWALFLFQAFSATGGFIIGPLLYIHLLEKHPLEHVFSKSGMYWTPVLLTIMIVLAFMVVNALVLRWNMELEFPEFMRGFERWAQQKEDEAAQLTRNLTAMDTVQHLLVALLVIAVLPAIGEELLFRGLIQNKVYAAIGNLHLAVWLTGILFSAIHLQFFGFFPRMLLGVLFGYLYVWSGNLWIPILAHFINNGFTLIVLYLNQRGMLDYDLDHPPDVPLPSFLLFLGISIALSWYFFNFYHRKNIDKRSVNSENTQ
jgi:uncharacterized protein